MFFDDISMNFKDIRAGLNLSDGLAATNVNPFLAQRQGEHGVEFQTKARPWHHEVISCFSRDCAFDGVNMSQSPRSKKKSNIIF